MAALQVSACKLMPSSDQAPQLPTSSSMPALIAASAAMAPLLVCPKPVSSFTPAAKGKMHNFAYEVPSTSLGDLAIVRKIVEREGCIEALQHLVKGLVVTNIGTTESGGVIQTASQRHNFEDSTGYCYMGPGSIRSVRPSIAEVARGTPTVAPLVLQSILDQLRVVGVEIIEMITKWRRSTAGAQTYQWRGLNYLHKMTTDLDFLASTTSTFEPLRALQLKQNPLLSPLHLNHPLLRREVRRENVTPEVIAQLQRLLPDGVSNGIGIDRTRLFEASKVLAQELLSERRREHLQRLADQFGGGENVDVDSNDRANGEGDTITNDIAASVTKRVHWSHRPITFSAPVSRGQPRACSTDQMNEEVTAARELLAQAEYELGSLREQISKIQQQLRDEEEGLVPPLPPDKRRRLKTQISSMTNDLKFRSGDVFQRRNELRRRESAVNNLATCAKQPPKKKKQLNSISDQQESNSMTCEGTEIAAREPSTLSSWSLIGLDNPDLLEAVLLQDELRRHDIIDKFANMRATATIAARHRARSAPAGTRRPPTGGKASARVTSNPLQNSPSSTLPITRMSVDDVQQFIDSLALGLAPLPPMRLATLDNISPDHFTYGALFKSQGIDGSLLATATDRDLEELGVSIRLHRVRILEAVQVYE